MTRAEKMGEMAQKSDSAKKKDAVLLFLDLFYGSGVSAYGDAAYVGMNRKDCGVQKKLSRTCFLTFFVENWVMCCAWGVGKKRR